MRLWTCGNWPTRFVIFSSLFMAIVSCGNSKTASDASATADTDAKSDIAGSDSTTSETITSDIADVVDAADAVEEVAPVDYGNPDCDPLMPAACAMPWPPPGCKSRSFRTASRRRVRVRKTPRK